MKLHVQCTGELGLALDGLLVIEQRLKETQAANEQERKKMQRGRVGAYCVAKRAGDRDVT